MNHVNLHEVFLSNIYINYLCLGYAEVLPFISKSNDHHRLISFKSAWQTLTLRTNLTIKMTIFFVYGCLIFIHAHVYVNMLLLDG